MKDWIDRTYYIHLLGILLLSFFPIFYNSFKFTNSVAIFFSFFFFFIYNTIKNKKFYLNKARIRVYFFLMLWTAYSLFTLVWAKSMQMVILNTHYVSLSLLTFIIFTQSVSNKRIYKYFYYCIIGIYFLYQLIALWELTTLNHLPTASASVKDVISFVPFGPFYNRNDMAAILLMLSPIVLAQVHISKNILFKTVGWLSFIFLFVITTLAGARISLIFLGIEFIVYLLFFTKLRSKIISLIVLFFIIISIRNSYPKEFKFFTMFLKNELESIQTETESIKSSSIKIRKALIFESVDMAYESYFFGVGAGNYIDETKPIRSKDTHGILIPHNFVLELLTEYGLVLTLIFIYILIRWFIDLYIIFRREKGNNKIKTMGILVSLIFFIPASVLPSSIIKYSFYWIMFALFQLYIEYNSQIQDND